MVNMRLLKGLVLFCTVLVFSTVAQSFAREAGGLSVNEVPEIFATSDQCLACHNQLTSPAGEDISIGSDWRSSMMAHSSRDPYWQAAVRREIMDHPSAAPVIENECSACHMPMARFRSKATGRMEPVFGNLPVGVAMGRHADLAADGVSCTMCHQIEDRGLGTRESFTAGFSVDTGKPPEERLIFGQFDIDAGHQRIMRSASSFLPSQSLHIQKSEVCATCHTLYTHSLGPNGEVVGELPEQVPYLEWKHSAYYETRSCQDCHMPTVAEATPITGVLGDPREGFSRHVFRGGNFFMVRMLNRHRGELGVSALPQEMDSTAQRTLEHLSTGAAGISIDDATRQEGNLSVQVRLENLAGHKLPTAYPSRRTWIHFTLSDSSGKVVFESGAFKPDGSINGNDNDNDAGKYEPHYSEIDDPGKVQIYEAILGAPDGSVTTGLLTAVKYLKDNRILPQGFDKETADPDIAVHGQGEGDPDFRAGEDTVSYIVDVGNSSGPYTIRAELLYQSIGYRWAHNLKEKRAAETDRFISYYQPMAGNSSTVLAADSRTVAP